MEPYVKRTDLQNGITEVEFFHSSHNSLPLDILRQLAGTITSCGMDDAVSVIILRSGGDRTFCAGASFDELVAINDLEKGRNFFAGFAHVINACRKCPKLIIGRIQGKAVGGGVGLAAAVDYCFATKFASVRLSELNIGIGPFVIAPAVERKIGLSAFSQLAMNASEFYDASWAHEKGLYAEVHDNAVSMDEAIMKLAENLAKTNPEARDELKKALWSGTDHWDQLLLERAGVSGRLVLSEFAKGALMEIKR